MRHARLDRLSQMGWRGDGSFRSGVVRKAFAAFKRLA